MDTNTPEPQDTPDRPQSRPPTRFRGRRPLPRRCGPTLLQLRASAASLPAPGRGSVSPRPRYRSRRGIFVTGVVAGKTLGGEYEMASRPRSCQQPADQDRLIQGRRRGPMRPTRHRHRRTNQTDQSQPAVPTPATKAPNPSSTASPAPAPPRRHPAPASPPQPQVCQNRGGHARVPPFRYLLRAHVAVRRRAPSEARNSAPEKGSLGCDHPPQLRRSRYRRPLPRVTELSLSPASATRY